MSEPENPETQVVQPKKVASKSKHRINPVYRIGPKQIEKAELEKRVLEMRKAGMTYRAIAEAIGYSNESAASKIVKRALRKIIQEPAEELIKLEMERLDMLWASLQRKVSEGDTRAAEVCVGIMKRRAELQGLDQPVKVQSQHHAVVMEIDATKPDVKAQLHDLLRQRPALTTGAEQPKADAEIASEDVEGIPQGDD